MRRRKVRMIRCYALTIFLLAILNLIRLHASFKETDEWPGDETGQSPITELGIIQKACDFGYKTQKRNDLRSGKALRTGKNVVCVRGTFHVLDSFFRDIVPNIRSPFTMVTLESDSSVPDPLHAPFLDNLTNLQAWYGWNIRIRKHPKLHALPIGLDSDRHQLICRFFRKNVTKNGRVLFNFGLHTHQDRRELWKKAAQGRYSEFADIIPKQLVSERVNTLRNTLVWASQVEDGTSDAYYDMIAPYSFAVAPRGAGEDTYRLWEYLYLHIRPIALDSPIAELYEGLPVVVLRNWDELTKDLIEQERNRTDLNFEAETLWLRYWFDRIRGHGDFHP